MHRFNPKPPIQILGGPLDTSGRVRLSLTRQNLGGGRAPGDLTFAVDVFSGLLLLHFLHILHVCRVQLSLVFTAETEEGGSH